MFCAEEAQEVGRGDIDGDKMVPRRPGKQEQEKERGATPRMLGKAHPRGQQITIAKG